MIWSFKLLLWEAPLDPIFMGCGEYCAENCYGYIICQNVTESYLVKIYEDHVHRDGDCHQTVTMEYMGPKDSCVIQEYLPWEG